MYSIFWQQMGGSVPPPTLEPPPGHNCFIDWTPKAFYSRKIHIVVIHAPWIFKVYKAVYICLKILWQTHLSFFSTEVCIFHGVKSCYNSIVWFTKQTVCIHADTLTHFSKYKQWLFDTIVQPEVTVDGRNTSKMFKK